MPLRWLEHDGQRYEIDDVLAGKVPAMLDRYPMSYLRACSEDRIWTGVPSVTQLIDGTRQSLLKIKNDYAVDPEERAWIVLGNRGHALLEGSAKEIGLSPEMKLRIEGFTGITDLIEPYDGYHRVVDYKVIGSFRVNMLVHGITAKKRREAATEDEVRAAIVKAWQSYGLQINAYRIAAEREHPELPMHPERPGWLFGIIRDGNTRAAHSYGIHDKTFFTRAPKWDDGKVLDYFSRKRDLLLEADSSDQVPDKCNDEESWEGRRCNKQYCPVYEHCKEAG